MFILEIESSIYTLHARNNARGKLMRGFDVSRRRRCTVNDCVFNIPAMN